MALDWKPIAALPDALKDGRQVLIWEDHGGATVCTWKGGRVASFNGWDTGFASEIDGSPLMCEFPAMFAEIVPPDA